MLFFCTTILQPNNFRLPLPENAKLMQITQQMMGYFRASKKNRDVFCLHALLVLAYHGRNVSGYILFFE
jgi:hypothetical protein